MSNEEYYQTEDDVRLEDALGDEEQISFRYSITSYGADFLIDGIVRRMQDESIMIPSFQRGFVWSLEKSSRFIESLLVGLPVPGIFLSKDPETQKLIVIDGQQRLKTIKFFFDGYFKDPGKAFSLEGIKSEFAASTYASLKPEDKRMLDIQLKCSLV